MSRTPFLLRDRGGPARLISPFTGLMLLTCAACLVFLGELVLNGERAGETELVPIEGGGEEVAEGEVTGAVPNGESSLIGNKAATIIRRIPVVGDRIADSFQNTNVRPFFHVFHVRISNVKIVLSR